MTAVDTSAEAVERLAARLENIAHKDQPLGRSAVSARATAAAATLRALAAERDTLRHSLDAADILAAALRDDRDRLAAENARLRAAVTAFFAAPLPPGRYTHTSGAMVVSLAAVAALREALDGDTGHD